MNLTADEEEKNSIARDDNQTGKEEAEEASESRGNIARATEVTILVKGTSKDAEDSGDTPTNNMKVLLQILGLSVASHNHLVEVEGNAEGPQEVGNEVVVDKDRDCDTQAFIVVYVRLEGNEEGRETNHNAHAEVHNEFDRVRSKPATGVDTEGNNHTESTDNREDHQHRHNDVEYLRNSRTR